MREIVVWCLKGLAMGAADVVPGVSGGTVAFITGIYDRLLAAISAFNVTLAKLLLSGQWRQAYKHCDVLFLLSLASGILISYFSLAHLIEHLLYNYEILLWSFFFGLVLASGIHILKQVSQWNAGIVAAIIIGIAAAYFIGILRPAELTITPLVIFLCASLAICAMILPGISGSFILLILGVYKPVIAAIKNLDWVILFSFAAGCGLGLLAFSHFLSYLLKSYRNTTFALLTGFLFGSLSLIWPWKHVLEYRVDSQGEKVAFLQENVLPGTYQMLLGIDSQWLVCLLLMAIGFALVFVLEKVSAS